MNHFLRRPFGCLVGSFFFLSWSWMSLMIKFLYNWFLILSSCFRQRLSCWCGVVDELAWSGCGARLCHRIVVPLRACRLQFLVLRHQSFCQQALMLALDSWNPSKLVEDFSKFLFWPMYFRHVSLYFMFSDFFSFLFYFFFNVDVLYSPS